MHCFYYDRGCLRNLYQRFFFHEMGMHLRVIPQGLYSQRPLRIETQVGAEDAMSVAHIYKSLLNIQ